MKLFHSRRVPSPAGVTPLALTIATVFAIGGHGALAAPTATAPAPAKSAPAMRTETINYDSWIVNCSSPVAGGEKKCAATLRVIVNRRMPILNWVFGVDKSGRPSTTLAVNSSLSSKDRPSGGLALKNGLDLKFGEKPPHHMDFSSCGGAFCVTNAAVDEAFLKEAQSGGKVTVTVYAAADNSPIPLVIDPKGIDKALAATFSK